MDNVIFAAIVSFIPYDFRYAIREALSEHLSPEDEKCIFEEDFRTIHPFNITDYIESLDNRLDDDEACDVFSILSSRKIFLSYCDWNNLCNAGNMYYEKMLVHVKRQPQKWFDVCPWRKELQQLVGNREVTKSMPLKYTPYTIADNSNDIQTIFKRYSERFTPHEIIKAYVIDCHDIYGCLRWKDFHANTIAVINSALEEDIMHATMDDELTQCMILLNPDKMHEDLRFYRSTNYEISYVHSYILAHVSVTIPEEYSQKMELIMDAPADLIVHAHKLSVIADKRPRKKVPSR